MKTKIITYTTSIVLFALILVTGGFTLITNIKEVNKIEDLLSSFNSLIIKQNTFEKELYSDFKINNNIVSFSVVNKNGNVVLDTINDVVENNVNKEEIEQALKFGEFKTVRKSKKGKHQIVYVFSKIDENNVLISSVSIKNIEIAYGDYLFYYIAIIIIVIMLTIILSLKFVKSIIFPIRELEEVTSKISNGDFSKRARVYDNNEIGSLAKTFNTMSEKLKAQVEDTQDKQNKLECILESMDSGVIAIDSKKSVIMINPYAKKIFGINDDIIGKKIDDYIKDKRIIDFIVEIPVLNKIELSIYSPMERILRMKKAPIIQEESYPMGTVVVVSDVTEVRKLEVMRSQFVANVSHELKTPLTSIKGFIETLRYVEDEEKKHKFFGIIESEADRLSRLINDILTLSSIENTFKVKNDNFFVKNTLDRAIEMVYKQAIQNNVKLESEIDFDSYITGDEDRFYQLIINLLENAIKYSGDGSVVKLIAYKEDSKFIVIVKDDGIGIPEQDLPRIFERFYRVDKARGSKGVNGTGLGLAIVKHIVKMFNAEIFVKSTLGVGTEFKVEFKLKGI